MNRIDARAYLATLVGNDIYTVTQRRRNRVLRVGASHALVATAKSPLGEPVPMEEVQQALDRLTHGEEVRVSVPSLGYRSAFVGAVLATVPGSQILRGPTRVALRA